MIHIMFVLKDKLQFYLLLDYIYMISDVSLYLFFNSKNKNENLFTVATLERGIKV